MPFKPLLSGIRSISGKVKRIQNQRKIQPLNQRIRELYTEQSQLIQRKNYLIKLLNQTTERRLFGLSRSIEKELTEINSRLHRLEATKKMAKKRRNQDLEKMVS